MKRSSFFLVLLLGACTTVGPDYKRPETGLPAQYEGKATNEAAQITANWWTLYGDAQLDQLVAAAQASNADLRFAVARVLEA